MELTEFIELSKQETFFVEKKNGIGDALGRLMAAYGTSGTGKALVGIEDSGTLSGLFYNDNSKKDLNVLLEKCLPKPTVNVESIPFEKGKVVLCITIHESKIKPTYFNGTAYWRDNGETKVCSNEQVLHFQIESGRLKFDALPCKTSERIGLLQDIDTNTVSEFLDAAKIKRNRTLSNSVRTEDVLSNLSLYNKNDNTINNAGILLFGKKPQEFCPQASITLSVFNSDSVSTEPFIRQQLNGNIFYLIENSVNLIKQYAPPVSRIEGLKRIDVYPYPYEALRELIINAIAHRDYFTPSEITIRLFKNRIEITNPGGVPKEIDFEKLINGENNLSVRRNQLISDVLDFAGYMDKAGYGFIKILTALHSQGLPKPEFPKVQDSFKAIIYAGNTTSGLSTTKVLDYPKGVVVILKTIIEAGTNGISNQELVSKSGYTAVYVSNITKILEDEKQIFKKRRGNRIHLFVKSS
ncbi:Uncharacterised protein [Candidatus Burarchaeum australiense]|nr:Uncharacterised protein [Candidatus Burarchaeum australiense]